jgi:hypothetical protein
MGNNQFNRNEQLRTIELELYKNLISKNIIDEEMEHFSRIYKDSDAYNIVIKVLEESGEKFKTLLSEMKENYNFRYNALYLNYIDAYIKHVKTKNSLLF